MAILVVLLITAMMSTLMITMTERWRGIFHRTEFHALQQQTKWTLLGGEALILHNLNTGVMLPINQPQSVQLDEYTVNFSLQDRQNCFNLNALVAGKKTHDDMEAAPLSYDQKIFRQLLILHGMEQHVIDRLQRALTAALPFSDISQLRSLPGVDRALYNKLAPLLCVHPKQRLLINLNGITQQQIPLLAALFAGQLTPAQASEILLNRPISGWKKIDELMPLPPESREALAELSKVSHFHSDEFELKLWMGEEEYHYRLHSQLRHKKTHFSVTQRQYGASD
ncbi:type II secretion system minor pseudopilin GspK [Serratia quinivorans]|uniref:type II secretion system minor pseudopilin GspK n=1 Tax=Serratia quinivorans TaxID=137545 RepID=UPI0021BDD1FD|nr:type II secretion system minor pseudopilin GspK [Serratia quinivorans]